MELLGWLIACDLTMNHDKPIYIPLITPESNPFMPRFMKCKGCNDIFPVHMYHYCLNTFELLKVDPSGTFIKLMQCVHCGVHCECGEYHYCKKIKAWLYLDNKMIFRRKSSSQAIRCPTCKTKAKMVNCTECTHKLTYVNCPGCHCSCRPNFYHYCNQEQRLILLNDKMEFVRPY